jgi:hypothetical protein
MYTPFYTSTNERLSKHYLTNNFTGEKI